MTMAKKRAGEKKDRHKSGFMVRLPMWLRGPIKTLLTRTRRAITTEVVMALEKHLTAEGIAYQKPEEGG
jgi:hypothetical protein